MTEHFADRAAFIATLPIEDEERKRAEEHARSCARCHAALEEGVGLVQLVRRALPPHTAGGAVHAKEGKPTDPRLIRPIVGALGVAWLFQLMVGGGFEMDFDCLTVSLIVLGVAIAGVAIPRWKERFAGVSVAAMLTTSGVFAYLSGTAAGLEPGIGIRCTFRELWAAAIAWTIVMTVARRSGVRFGKWSTATVAAGSALAAHAGQHLACRVPHSEAHLLIFHFGGVVVATLLGAAAAKRGLLVGAAS